MELIRFELNRFTVCCESQLKYSASQIRAILQSFFFGIHYIASQKGINLVDLLTSYGPFFLMIFYDGIKYIIQLLQRIIQKTVKYGVDHKIKHFACERDFSEPIKHLDFFRANQKFFTTLVLDRQNYVSHKQNVLFYGLPRNRYRYFFEISAPNYIYQPFLSIIRCINHM